MHPVVCVRSVDPVLNRGVALENSGRFAEAVDDYRAVLGVAPDDPSAWNNLGEGVCGARGCVRGSGDRCMSTHLIHRGGTLLG